MGRLLVIFGAGASYDSIPSMRPDKNSRSPEYLTHESSRRRHRLPLADDLFLAIPDNEAIQRRYPSIIPIVPLVNGRPSETSVEAMLQLLSQDVPKYPARERQLLAVRFYLQSLIRARESQWSKTNVVATNHMALLDEIEAERGTRAHPLLVTFNYDCMIEQALEMRGGRFKELGDYVANDRPWVIKLHGSTNWARSLGVALPPRLSGDELADHIAAMGKDLPSLREITLVDGDPLCAVGAEMGIPAIAIPLRGKNAFECPMQHLAFFDGSLPDVRAVITIGWSAGEPHFLPMLRDKLSPRVKGICVSGSARWGEDTIRAMREAGVPGEWQAFNGGFSDFVVGRHARAFLQESWRE